MEHYIKELLEREETLTNTVPWSLSKSSEAELVWIIFRIEVVRIKLILKKKYFLKNILC